jgi:hypothetical protein
MPKNPQSVPDAPFRTTWHQYVMKRILRMAAEGDYKYVAWTAGKMQADRYALQKQIGEIRIRNTGDGSYIVGVDNPAGERISDLENLAATQDEIARVYGKDLGGRMIAAADAANGEIARVSGDGLTIGGEGMSDFYDISGRSSQNIPRFMDKYVRQWGSKVQTIDVTGHAVPDVEVTEAMREDVLYKGQPRFSLRDTSDVNTGRVESDNPELRKAVGIFKGISKLTEARASDAALQGFCGSERISVRSLHFGLSDGMLRAENAASLFRKSCH